MPMAFESASTNGSQFFFWLTDASVEITPKLSSAGVSACANMVLPARTAAANAAFLKCDDMTSPVCAEFRGLGEKFDAERSGVEMRPLFRPAPRQVERNKSRFH